MYVFLAYSFRLEKRQGGSVARFACATAGLPVKSPAEGGGRSGGEITITSGKIVSLPLDVFKIIRTIVRIQ